MKLNKDRFEFRGLSKGKWYYGAYFKHLPYTPYCCGGEPPEKDYKHLIIQEGFSDWGLPRNMSCVEVDKDTIGQCTGLKDKNGKLIYEGDIVRTWKFSTGITKLSVIVWNEARCGFRLCDIDNYQRNIHRYPQSMVNVTTIEVLGNIYENPELLEEKDVNL